MDNTDKLFRLLRRSDAVNMCLDKLPADERDVLMARVGGETLLAIAVKSGAKKERIRHHERKAVKKMCDMLFDILLEVEAPQ